MMNRTILKKVGRGIVIPNPHTNKNDYLTKKESEV